MFRSVFVIGLVLTGTAASLAAQQADAVATPGQVVRLRQGNTASSVGTLLSAGPDTVFLMTSSLDTLAFLRNSVTGVDLLMGTQSNAGKGAVKGLVIGGLVGLALGGITAASQDESDFFYVDPGQLVLSGTLSGALLGGAIGAIAGAGSHSPRWVSATLPKVTVQPGAVDGKGVAVGMRLRF